MYNKGSITAEGVQSSTCSSSNSNGRVDPGGSSGGGSINIFANCIKERNIITAAGGANTRLSTIGGAGGNGAVTISELGSNLEYSENPLILQENEEYQIDRNKFSYVKLNEIQTEDLVMGELKYEAVSPEIATVTETGKITAKKNGVAKIKVTDIGNGNSTYIDIEVRVKMESIVQGFRDINLPDGTHKINVNGKDYMFELINYYDDVVYTENTELGDDTTEYKTLVVKYHKNLTINEGVTITAKQVNNLTYKKGMYVCVLGDIYNNGTISMTARGTYNQVGEDVYLWKNIDGTYEYVPAVGGAGGARISGYRDKDGNQGIAGTNRSTGGGGSGGVHGNSCTVVSGAGSAGTSYSGGSGGGSVCRMKSNGNATDAQPNGGAGGNGSAYQNDQYNKTAGGGAGNRGGAGARSGGNGGVGQNGENGTGGLLVIYTNTLYNSGNISSNGSNGGGATPSWQNGYSWGVAGGSSGGGSINIFTEILEEYGNITANGGNIMTSNQNGGAGGNGSITINEVSSLLNYPEKKIQIKQNSEYKIVEESISYTKLNEIQTVNLAVGELTYETLNPDIATINENGLITAKKAGTTKIKITDTENEKSTYVIVEVIDQVTKSQIKAGDEFTLALKENGTVWTYGKDISNEPIQVEFEEKIIGIGAGDESRIALTENGEVYTWGKYYTVGNISGNREKPVKESLTNIKQVDCVETNFYALDKDGNVYIWGNGYTEPTKIETNVKIAEISGKLLLGENGKVYTVENPTQEIEWLKDIATMAQGEDHSLFVTTTGHIHSIGKGEKGQLGNGKTQEKVTPTLVKTEEGYLQNVVAVSAGSKTSMALTIDGKAYVWGDNSNNKLGIEEENILYPKQITNLQTKDGTILELKEIENIETGRNHSLISDKEGFVYGVGLNTDGQLGTSDNKNKLIYTEIRRTILTTNKEEYRLGIGKSETIVAKLENLFNLKNDIIDADQRNFNILSREQDIISITDKTITSLKYGNTTLTVKHKTGVTKDVQVKIIEDMESIVQGFRDINLPDGTHEVSINGQEYTVELVNYYDDVTYTQNTELGDNTTEYKTLVVKYHKNLTINEGVTLTAKQVDNLTYKKGMYICVLGDIHNNGTISMTARGTYNQAGEDVYLWKNINDTYEYVPAVGGAGAKGAYISGGPVGQSAQGNEGGKSTILRGTGGGGSGTVAIYNTTAISGKGSAGTSYSGGSGSGGVYYSNTSGTATSSDAGENGGAGSNGYAYDYGTDPITTSDVTGGGGAGNKGGKGYRATQRGGTPYNDATYNGENGTGGLLIIYSDTLYNKGTLISNGSKGGKLSRKGVEGGSSGAGSINIFARIVEEKGIQEAKGGRAIAETKAGAGGDGSITTNILGSILHYPEEKLTIKTKDTYQLNEEKFYYEKLNEIQTHDLTVGKLKYEIEDGKIASINEKGEITAILEGTTRIKITDQDNHNYSTYITIEVIDQERVYINSQEIEPNKGKEGYKDGTYYYAILDTETEAKVKVTAGNEFATVEFNGNSSLYELEQDITLDKNNKITEVPVTITSKDGIIYETVIYIEKVSNNKNLGAVKINEEEIEAKENKFTKYIDEAEDIVNLRIDSEHELAKIVITDKEGNIILDENGEPEEYKNYLEKEINTDKEIVEIYFKVVAENGEESQVYEIYIEKVSRDADLKEVYVKGSKIEANENGEYIAYVLDIDETAIVKAVANNQKADVKIADGENTVHITEKEINLVADKVAESTNEKTEQADKLQRTKETTTEGSKEKQEATTENTTEISDTESVANTETKKEKEESPIEVPIVVTPKLGEAKVHYLYIYKMSTSLDLEEITLDGIAPNYYNEKTYTYTFIIDKIKEDFNISAIAQSKYTELKYGETKQEGKLQTTVKVETTEEGKCFKIIAESKAGTTREYKIDIIHKEEQEEVQYLKVNDKILSKNEQGNYEVKIGDNIEKIDIMSAIIGQTQETTKSIDINNTGEYETPSKQVILEKEQFIGKESIQIPIKVKAEDGSIKENVLIINFQKGTYISGRILTENVKGEYISEITVYKLSKLSTKQAISTKQKTSNNTVNRASIINTANTNQIIVSNENINDKNTSNTVNKDTSRENTINEYSNSKATNNITRVGNFQKEEIAKVKTNKDGTFKILVYMPEEIEGTIDGAIEQEKQTIGEKYEIVVTKQGYLDYTVRGIKVEEEKVTTLEPYKLIAGDIIKTGEIELDDLVNLNERYGSASAHPECDLNEDGKVDKIDREILKKNYTRRAEILNLDIKKVENRLIKTGDIIEPIAGKYKVTSNYGIRIHPITGEEKLHKGIDIVGEHHTEILSVADGEVTFSGSQNGYGNCIEIKHEIDGKTIYSFYAHLSKIDEHIKVGNKVQQGQIIGLEGGDPDTDPNPGTSTGHHLHFEIR